jgi:hypothetical protein
MIQPGDTTTLGGLRPILVFFDRLILSPDDLRCSLNITARRAHATAFSVKFSLWMQPADR